MNLLITFLIGFCIGGIVGVDSPRNNTNTPPPIQPKRPSFPRRYN